MFGASVTRRATPGCVRSSNTHSSLDGFIEEPHPLDTIAHGAVGERLRAVRGPAFSARKLEEGQKARVRGEPSTYQLFS